MHLIGLVVADDRDQIAHHQLGLVHPRIGLAPATAFQASNVYEVQGTVKVVPAGKGKEHVAIVWVVLGPDGEQLGVVRQERDVRKGSLDKRWGPAADAAAAAAAPDIAALFPR